MIGNKKYVDLTNLQKTFVSFVVKKKMIGILGND